MTGEKHFWSGRVNDGVLSPGLMILSLIISANYLPAFFFFFLPCKISPWWLSGKESACQCRRPQFDPWVGKIPWRSEWPSTPVFLPGESYGQRGLAGYSPQSPKESGTTEATWHGTSQPLTQASMCAPNYYQQKEDEINMFRTINKYFGP